MAIYLQECKTIGPKETYMGQSEKITIGGEVQDGKFCAMQI